MNTIDKDKVAFWVTVVGSISSLSALTYILLQHRKNQASRAKQDALVKAAAEDRKRKDFMDARLRNLELAQCSNPQVSSNPQLMELLNCPRTQQAGSVSPGAQIMRRQAAPAHIMPPQHEVHMPNYGFFGGGPSGIESSGSPIEMPAFATTPTASSWNVVPFEK
uniref:Uncharacterized protein n=1 Tax=viral metagenome TaxID=1070528 RepID=A0A6C0BNS2_9ZZZZ